MFPLDLSDSVRTLSVSPSSSPSAVPLDGEPRAAAQPTTAAPQQECPRPRTVTWLRARRLAAINAYRGAVEAATATASMHGLAAGAGWWAVKDHDGGLRFLICA